MVGGSVAVAGKVRVTIGATGDPQAESTKINKTMMTQVLRLQMIKLDLISLFRLAGKTDCL